jgi:hypothetical protein
MALRPAPFVLRQGNPLDFAVARMCSCFGGFRGYDFPMLIPRPLALVYVVLAGCVSGPAPRRGEEFRERLLATLPEERGIAIPVAFSRDGTRVAYVERGGESSRAACGEWRGAAFSLI